jgi:hypothetical protein
MQNGISSGCNASKVKCQVSNYQPVGGAGEIDGWYRLGGWYCPGGLEGCAHLHVSQTHLA